MSPLSFSSVIHLRTCCRAPSAAALAGRVGDTESSASMIVTLSWKRNSNLPWTLVSLQVDTNKRLVCEVLTVFHS